MKPSGGGVGVAEGLCDDGSDHRLNGFTAPVVA